MEETYESILRLESTLYPWFRVIPEDEALRILNDLLTGIKALLKMGIIHRDIKPANILMHDK